MTFLAQRAPGPLRACPLSLLGTCLSFYNLASIHYFPSPVFLTFSNLWKVLSMFRSLATGYDVQLLGDVTTKASTAALNKLGIGLNMFGNQHRAQFY